MDFGPVLIFQQKKIENYTKSNPPSKKKSQQQQPGECVQRGAEQTIHWVGEMSVDCPGYFCVFIIVH